MGCISTRNLTNHASGLANATDAAIKNAFRNGMRTDGKKLAPVMPYWIFHNLTDDDADAIVAYLRTVPGVDHTVKANEPPWSLFNDGTIPMVPVINPDNEIPFPRGGDNNEAAMRGRYLSSMAGLCIDCHTPELAPPQPVPLDFSRPFGGGRLFPKGALGLIDPSYPDFIVTRNLTPSQFGLMGWTKDQIKEAISKGKDRDGNSVCAATHGAMISPYAALKPQDLDDIAEYLIAIEPLDNNPYTVDGTATGNPKDCSLAGGNQDCTNCQGPAVP
jgi:mono/diheme cytochrome c family protein